MESNSEKKVNYVNNQGGFEAITKEIKVGLTMTRLDIRTRIKKFWSNNNRCRLYVLSRNCEAATTNYEKMSMEDING